MSLIRKHGAVLQAWACLDLVFVHEVIAHGLEQLNAEQLNAVECTYDSDMMIGC